MNEVTYYGEFSSMIDSIYHKNPGLTDHRQEFPWGIGAIGDPLVGIWFVAENPSKRMAEMVRDPQGGPPTKEAQWWASRGDKLLREMLVKYGCKDGPIESHGGWHCYITNIIKYPDYTSEWREKSQAKRYAAAETWAPVLSWELRYSKPCLVVIMGGQTEKLLNYLTKQNLISLPNTMKLTHYAYIGQRAEGKLGPMHPERIKRYDDEFANIRRQFDQLCN